MKIAVYTDLPFGGAHVAMEEILGRLKKNHQIQVFKNRPNTFNTSFLKRLWADIESIVLQSFKQHQQAIKIDQGGFDLVFVSHDHHFQAPWILRFLKTPTVFLCQEPTRAFFEKFLDVDPSLPLINKIYERINRWIRKGIEVKNAQFATKIVSNSKFSSKSILNAYNRSSTPIHMGVNTKNFFPLNLKQKNQVMVVGNNEPQKALSFTINCLSLINKTVRPKLVIVSPRSRDNRELLVLARKKGVNIEILEGITVKHLCEVYNTSKILLAVAYLEPFGMSVIQSLACGTPVVAISEGGYVETVIHQKTGLLVKRNSILIAKAISKLLQNSLLREKMGKEGVSDVKRRFLWSHAVIKIEKIFYEVA